MTGRAGIRGRLAASIALILVASLSLTFFAVHRGTESELNHRIDDDLRGKSDDLAGQLRGARPATPHGVLDAADRRVAAQGFGQSSQVIAITVPGAGIATNQPELLGLPSEGEHEGDAGNEERSEADAIRGAPTGFSEIRVEDVGEVRVLSRDYPTYPSGPSVRILVGEPSASVDRALSGLSRTFLLVGGATLILALGAGLLVATRTTAPLRRMSRTGEEIDAGDLSRRLEVPQAHDEVRALAESFNRMLERLQHAFSGQRRFVADASHELRTPLTVIRGQLEVLTRAPRVDREDLKRVTGVVTTEVERMERMIEDMLALARADREHGAEHRLIEIGRVAREAFEPMAVTTDRRLEVGRIDSGKAPADPELIAQLVRILARNAIEHTSGGGRIRLSAVAEDDAFELSIEDDGPGIPPEERALVFERFHRAEGSREGSGGAGLGLAIAQTIVEAHGGRIEAGESELGGARLTARLPR
jgi:two-component system OmpR family sensor kinase